MFMIIYVSMVNENRKTTMYMNLEDAAMLRMENTFYLLDKSLGTTWYISTAQSIFHTGEEGIGCGYSWDEAEQSYLTNDMKEGYWYQTAPDRQKPFSTRPNPIPQNTKYNQRDCNPMICLPYDTDDKYLKDYLDKKMEPYHDIKLEFNVNDINVKIAELNKDNINTNFYVWPDKITTTTTQKIKMEDTWNTKIDTTTRNDAVIYTEMKKMIEAGEFIIKYLLFVSDTFPTNYQYTEATPNAEFYKNYIKDIVIAPGLSAAERAKFMYTENGEEKYKAKISIDYKTFELKARTANEGGFYEDLLLHYDANVKMIEGQIAPQINYIFEWPTGSTGSRRITSCYGPRMGGYHFGIDIGRKDPSIPSNDPIYAVEDGKVINVVTDCVVGVKPCEKYGNYVAILHNNGLETRYAHLESVNVVKEQEVKKGELIGTMGETGDSDGIHLHFEVIEKGKEDPCRFMHCEESTLRQCPAITLTEEYEGYYYHDEDENKFLKRSFSLVFGVEDYLPVLSCSWDDMSIIYKLYTWSNPNDMVCCGGMLWVCCSGNQCPGIKDLPTEQKILDGHYISENDILGLCNTPIKCQSGTFSVVYAG
jgi:murein DD-endopeptidase MepM/ murein hydrolase activator NlpD